MKTNGGGEANNRAFDFGVYDNLPPLVREVLANGPMNLTSLSARRLLYKYDEKETVLTVQDFIVDVMQSGDDTNEGHDESTRRYWGNDHPQASRDCKWPYKLTRRTLNTRTVRITK